MGKSQDVESKERIMMKITILRAARRMIQRGSCRRICAAIYAAQGIVAVREGYRLSGPYYTRIMVRYARCGDEIRTYIMRKLNPHNYYEDWLERRSKEFRNLTPSKRNKAEREGRIAWIDYMIESLKAEL